MDRNSQFRPHFVSFLALFAEKCRKTEQIVAPEPKKRENEQQKRENK
jgi:hypothetical protein